MKKLFFAIALAAALTSITPAVFAAGCCVERQPNSDTVLSCNPQSDPTCPTGTQAVDCAIVPMCSQYAGVTTPPVASPVDDGKKTPAITCDPGPNYKAPTGILSDLSVACAKCGSCEIADFFRVGNKITKFILGLSGSVLLLMIIYGGFLMLTSSGNSSMVEKGKKVLVSSLIGLVIVFGAYVAVQFIMGAMGVTNIDKVFQLPFESKQ